MDLRYIHIANDVVDEQSRADRFDKLVSLLKTCKGTVYLLTRPSIYEECLLSPARMESRFADNQRNNVRKRRDTRELNERRAKDSSQILPMTEAEKGRKRSASITVSSDHEITMVNKRQKAAEDPAPV
ncbi:hypothetical protein RUND412_007587 [Rhizina undulata]